MDRMRLGTPGPDPYSLPLRRGEFFLEGGSLSPTQIQVFNGGFQQTGGTNTASTITLPAYKNRCQGEYSLSGGTLVSGDLSMGVPNWPEPPGTGSFSQTDGVHKNGSIALLGQFRNVRRLGYVGVEPLGLYSKAGGLLVSTSLTVRGGSFSQSGGSSRIGQVSVTQAGRCALTGGDLTTANTSLGSGCTMDAYTRKCYVTTFTQEGGTHIVEDTLRVSGFSSYILSSGKLVAQNITIGGDAKLSCEHGKMINPGMFTIQGGSFRAGNRNHELGQLQVLNAGIAWGWAAPPDAYSLDVSGPGHSVISFRDSRDVFWESKS
jgi:hypothetical protein